MSPHFPVRIRIYLRLIALFFFTFLFSGTNLRAQEGAWKLYSMPSPRTDVAFVSLPDKGGLLLFGGIGANGRYLDDTWEYRDGVWKRFLVNGPSARSRAAITYDDTRHVAVLFGGLYRDTVLGDVWEWNGSRWKQKAKNQKNAPTAREGASFAHDPLLDKTILFGGRNGGSFYSDTWEWNGSSWKFVTVAAPPSPRYKQAMAYCANAGGIVMFGGLNVGADLADTWLYQNGNWQPVVGRGPSAREAAAFASMPDGSLLLYGGANGSQLPKDTWKFSGSSWSKIKGRSPAGRAGAGLSLDGKTDDVILFGGWRGGDLLDETWKFSGNKWKQITFVQPPARTLAATAWDAQRGRLVVFGGKDASGAILQDTWEWNPNHGWQEIKISGPGARFIASMAWDAHRKEVVLHGGLYIDNGSWDLKTDTWSFDGMRWLHISDDGPYASGAMAYCDALNTVVLVQGNDFLTDPAQLFKLTDSGWVAVATAQQPEQRTHSAMVRNPADGSVTMFGGYGYHWSHMWPILYNDLWTYAGSEWQTSSAEAPKARQDHGIGYIAGNTNLYVHGGTALSRDPNWSNEYYSYVFKYLGETWRWTGSDWKFMSRLGPMRAGHGVFYADSIGKLMLFGGEDKINGASTVHNDLWVLDPAYAAKGKIDLAIDSVGASSTGWDMGNSVTVTAHASNPGGGSVSTVVHFYLSLDDQLDDGDALIASVPAAALTVAGKTITTIISVSDAFARLPTNMVKVAYNNGFMLIAAVDEFEQMGDKNWLNNVSSMTDYITLNH